MKSLVEVIIISLLLQFGCAEESILDRLNIPAIHIGRHH